MNSECSLLRSPASVDTRLFWQGLTREGLSSGQPEEKDTPISRAWLTVRGRGPLLEEAAAKKLCRECGRTVLKETFLLTAEMLLAELQKETQRLHRMVSEKKIDREGVTHLLQTFRQTLNTLTKAIRSLQKTKKNNREWAREIEGLFRLMVLIINEMLGL